MFSNFTTETCTGTGATLTLTGATTGQIAFSESFADGDLVSYALEDSGGSIKIAGIGTYVSATDDITRNDTWNWNGTVVDKNPATNIALSAGAHTVRCDVTQGTTSNDLVTKYAARFSATEAETHTSVYGAYFNNRLNIGVFEHLVNAEYTIIGTSIAVAGGAGTFIRCGIYTQGLDGLPDKLVVDSGAMA